MIVVSVNWIKSKRILGYHAKKSFTKNLYTKMSCDDLFDDFFDIGMEGRRLRVV